MPVTAAPAKTATPSSPVTQPINRINPHIVVLGGGFGGLQLAKSLANTNARVTLVDRQNHHLFQPLLYQVATASLSSVDIAQPIRAILSTQKNTRVIMAEVQGIDLKARTVKLPDSTLDYDYLVIALGGVTSYFGHQEWAQFAPGLKSINDALRIRREILFAFEKAELTKDEAERKKLMTVVIVGGGPTGVEMAGACKELGRYVMKNDFRNIDPTKLQVILIEAADRLLLHLPRDLSESAKRQLEQIGVEIRLKTMVKDIKQNQVILDGETIEASCIVWSAGVGANPLTKTLGVEVDRAGRIKVNPDLSLPGFPEAFAVGDVAALTDVNGVVVPGVSPAAIQMGQFVAKTIETEIADPNLRPDQRALFAYWDKGTMATIGRSRAVAMFAGLKFGGFFAWIMWLAVHLLFLVGFTNKITVFIEWAWAYFTHHRGARVVTAQDGTGITPVSSSPPAPTTR